MRERKEGALVDGRGRILTVIGFLPKRSEGRRGVARMRVPWGPSRLRMEGRVK